MPEAYGSSYEEDARKSDEHWQNRAATAYEGNGSVMFFALDGTTPVGMAGAFWSNSEKKRHIADIVAVYVKPDYRRQGLARRILISLMEDLLMNRNIERVVLAVVTTNTAAHTLYRSLGFQPVGTVHSALKVNGTLYDELLMEREL